MMLEARMNYEVAKRELDLAKWKQRQIDAHNAMMLKIKLD